MPLSRDGVYNIIVKRDTFAFEKDPNMRRK